MLNQKTLLILLVIATALLLALPLFLLKEKQRLPANQPALGQPLRGY
ncbi:MAG TPA: hypothetical protein VIM58_06120 [Candidatus Methylacidiphilales bacterium]